LSISNYV